MMTTAEKTWKELEAEGVRRCCARFRNGKRCRRRADVSEQASAEKRDGFCEKHGRQIRRVTEGHMAIIRAEADGSLYPKTNEEDLD